MIWPQPSRGHRFCWFRYKDAATVELSAEGETVKGTLANGQLTLDQGEGATLTFEKKDWVRFDEVPVISGYGVASGNTSVAVAIDPRALGVVMVSRRSFLLGSAGAGAVLVVGSPAAQAKVYGKYDVPDYLLGLYESNKSKIGLPKSGVKSVDGGKKQSFANGDMYHGSKGAGFVTGKIKSAYDKAGGPAKLGLPIGLESKSSKYKSYTQKFTKGRIFYSSKDGAKVVPSSKTVRMKGCKNFRDVSGEGSGIRVTGGYMKRGAVYRSNKLTKATSMDKFIIQTLGIGTMMRISPSSTPSISGVKSVHYNIKNPPSKVSGEKHAMYRQYITSKNNRKSVGKALKLIATSDKPVVFQCLRGWDRSGWVSAVIQGVLGASQADITAEFLKSNKYYGNGVRKDFMDVAVAQMKSSYGSYEKYALACGVDAATIKALRNKLTV